MDVDGETKGITLGPTKAAAGELSIELFSLTSTNQNRTVASATMNSYEGVPLLRSRHHYIAQRWL